ncbi:MAG TPA: hypothetical protein VIU11_07945 [Nakamurella sp.]
MTEPNTSDPVVDDDSPRAQEPPEPDRGVGIGTSDEPDTFEPEEP